MLTVQELKYLTNKFPSGLKWIQDEKGDFTFPEATSEQEAEARAILAAFDPATELAAYEATVRGERNDLSELLPKIITELNYINTTLTTIDTMTTAQVRDVVKRILQEQQAELRAWRHVIRQLVG